MCEVIAQINNKPTIPSFIKLNELRELASEFIL